MDPVTAGIGIASTAIGAGVSAYGQLQSGQAQSDMYRYQSGVAQVNKQIAEQNRDYEFSLGEVEAQREGMKTRAQIGETQAIQGASNLDVKTGSAAAVRTSEAEIGRWNQAVVRSDAARRAYGHEVEATQATAQGQLYSMASSNASEAGKIGAIGSLLGGASSVSSKWMQAKSVGLFG